MTKLFSYFKTQKTIFFFALLITALFNITFFTKLYHFGSLENNTLMIWSSPFVLLLIHIAILNILLLLSTPFLFRITLALLLLISAISGYFIDSFGTIIDQDMLINVVQTDAQEALSLITPKLLIYLVLTSLGVYWILFRLNPHFQSYKIEILQKAIVAILALGMIGGIYMIVSKSYSSFFRNHKELKMYLNPFYPTSSATRLIYAKLKPIPKFESIAQDATRQEKERKKLMIFILGETARAENFSLGGYTQATNPLLAKRNDIVYLFDVASCGTATAISVPCMFSKFGRQDWNSDKEYYENVVDVLMKTGVRVIWNDNNSGKSKGVANRVLEANYFKGTTYDEILLKDLQGTINKDYKDTLVVLHQEGSHGPTYFERYPDKFKLFTPTCDTQDLQKCSQEQIVNTYNNTIVYTDYIINETIELLKANEDKYDTTLIYVSDHGESLGENGVYLHGLPYMIAPKAQKHVPAIVYFNQKQNQEQLQARAKESFSHDNIFHTLLGFFEVKTHEYKPALDLLNNQKHP